MIGTRVPSQHLSADRYMCSRCGVIHNCNISRPKPRTCLACQLPAQREAAFPDQGWAVDASCAQASTSLWFPGNGSDQGRAAKAVCAACPVLVACRGWALAVMPEYGVWGGLSASERRRLVVA